MENTEYFDPSLIPAPTPTIPRSEMAQTSAITALLSNPEDPVAAYEQSMAQFQGEGSSRIAENVIKMINQDTDASRNRIMSKIITDATLSVDNKKAAIDYYIKNREVYPPLRETYAEAIAASNPAAPFDTDAFLNSYLTKEFASNVMQKEAQSVAMEFDGEATDVLASFGASAFPWAGGFAQMYQGWNASEILAAIKGKEPDFIDKVWNTLAIGNTKENIREALAAMPPAEQIAAIKRATAVLKKNPNFDWDKYVLLEDTLDPTGDYSKFEKYIDNGAVILSFLFGGWALKSASRVAPTISKTVKPHSVLGTTSAYNPGLASKMVDAALDGKAPTEALGATEAEIVSSLFFKYDDQLLRGITPEASANLRYIDQGGKDMLTAQGNNPLLYTRETRDAVRDRILELAKSAKNMVIHPGKSSMSSVDELATEYDMGIKGKATFGKDEVNPFTEYDDAVNAAEKYLKKAKEGTVKIVSIGEDGKFVEAKKGSKGEYFVQWDYDHKFNPWDAVLYGNDAVKLDFTLYGARVPILSDLANWSATTKYGRFFWAHHAQPKAVSDSASRVFDKAVEMERPFMTGLLKHVASQSAKVRKELEGILAEGEEAAKVFSFEEIKLKGLAKRMSVKEAEDLATSYVMFRRVGDWMYLALNKSTRMKDVHDGVKKIVLSPESHYNGWTVARNELKDVRKVYDATSDSFITLGRTVDEGGFVSAGTHLDSLYRNGGTLVRLRHAMKEGDEIVQYAIARRGFSVSEIDDFVLPYIKGYVPRTYKNPYFVTRTPANVMVDGVKKSGDGYTTVVAAADSKKEAEAIKAKLAKDDPTAKYDWKRDRADEASLIEDATQYSNSIRHSRHRGEKVLDNAQRLDPLVSMYGLVTSVSKYAAMDEMMIASKEAFVKAFKEFLPQENGIARYPKSRNEIDKPLGMSGSKEAAYRQATTAFDYLESLMPSMRVDQQMWKEGMIRAAEVAEKLSVPLAQAIRGLSGVQHPLEQLRRLATVMYIYLRPNRQIFLQPSALALLMGQDAKYLNPFNIWKFSRTVSALQFAGVFHNVDTPFKKIADDNLILATFSKMAGMPVNQFKTMVKDLQETGFLPSVDTQAIVEGAFSSARNGLVETGLEQTGRYAANVAGVLPKIGKKVGFDIGERFNLVGSWILARERFLRKNPNAEMNAFAKEQIAADAREMALSMTRAGSFSYQRNILAIPLQFLAVPHKAVLALTTSKMWTPAEKARLAATHFMMYGAYGLGLKGVVDALKEEFPDALTQDGWDLVTAGLMDTAVNTFARVLIDDKDENTRVAISASFSPLSGEYGIVPFAEFLSALQEKDVYTVLMGPSWNLVNPEKGRVFEAYRKISSLLSVQEEINESNITEILQLAAEVASGGSDAMKFRYALDSGKIVSSSKNVVHNNATRAEAMFKLFGLATKKELEIYDRVKSFKDIEEEAREDAEMVYRIYDKVIRPDTELDNDEEIALAQKKVDGFLSLMKTSDPGRYANFLKHYKELEKRDAKTLEDSVNLRIMRKAMMQSDENRAKSLNLFPPELRARLNDMTNSEDY